MNTLPGSISNRKSLGLESAVRGERLPRWIWFTAPRDVRF
jgi:hypothetical protein